MSSDLVTFIRARLDEDERVARTAIQAAGGADWRHSDGRFYPEDNPSQHPGPFLADTYEADPGFGEHIARHDPARVLREVEARHRTLIRHRRDERGACIGCGWSGDLDEPRTDAAEECPELLDMASVWSDHEAYRSEWAP